MAKSMSKRYNDKKDNAKQRGIDFSLTLDEYKSLFESAKSCAYTDVSFDHTVRGCKSIERVIDSEGYHSWNCVVTTVKANQLKDFIVRNCGKLPISDVELIPKIKKSFEDHKNRILNEKSEILKEKLMSETENNSAANSFENHIDIVVAQAYTKFATKEGVNTFGLSFSMFKKKFLKKKCELSGKEFTDENGTYLKQAITKKDYSKPFSDNNVTVICQVFDNMLRNNLFTQKELVKVADNFN